MELTESLDKISTEIVSVLTKFIKKEDFVLEFGSSTGHISLCLLKEGYRIHLLDIRKEPIREAIEIFRKENIETTFYVQDFLDHHKRYDIIWNSGCIQCCNYTEKKEWLRHCRKLAKKVILFWPDKAEEQRDTGRSIIKGFDHAREYDSSDIYDIAQHYYENVIRGTIECTGLEYKFKWMYGESK